MLPIHNMLLILITTIVLYLGGDIYLPNNSNITYIGIFYSYIGTYQLPSFVTNKSYFLAGSQYFLIDQVEVYALNV